MAVIGVGVDMVDVARLAQVLTRTPSVVERVFGDEPVVVTDTAVVRRLAGRFAAKEAATKALGAPGGTRWREIEVENEPGGRPRLVVHGHTAAAAARAGIVHWHVSITHDAGMAVAVVVAES